MTLQQRVDEVDAVQGVIVAYVSKAPALIDGAGVHHAKISWYYLDGGIAKQGGGELIVVNSGLEGETAYWAERVPTILAPPVADAYITGRNTPFTKAQVEAFCNAQWKATVGNGAARDVIEFAVSNVSANTVRVSGLFHDAATGNRLRLIYLISLVDANGATTGANVKFERVVE